MPKGLSPVFPPRRPSSVVRYLLAIVLIITVLYAFNHRTPVTYSSPNLHASPATETLPASHDGTPPGSQTAPETHDDEKPVVKPEVDESSSQAGDEKEHSHGTDSNEAGEKVNEAVGSGSDTSSDPEDSHPIGKLIYDAQHIFAELMSKESRSIEDAAQAYRKRRGRHPPPGFDRWYEFARDKNSVIVEDFFDQIYHDLEPFWGMEPTVLRKESWDFEMTIHVRDGKAESGSDWFWTVIWLDLIKTIEHLLPDMDLALNAMDEPRLVVPWEDINKYMRKAAKTVNLPKAKKVRSDSQKLPEPGKGDLMTETRPKEWEDTSKFHPSHDGESWSFLLIRNVEPYWAIARRGCAPDSLARTTDLQESFHQVPDISMKLAEPHMFNGYVSNYSMSTDVCHQPDLQGLEGILIAPLSTSASKVMFPMFGGSKLGINNEILLPAPMYWNEEERFTGGDDHGIAWQLKETKAVWRGVATGGRNTAHNWRGFQRHRFVSMNNGTKLSSVEAGQHKPENFVLPDKQYKIQAQSEGKLGEWVSNWTDVSFIDLMCDPPMDDGSCDYTAPYFDRAPGLRMAEQFDYKYVPDIDGNSFSGRYLGFLRSTSLPVKSTIWREWHDSRLVAWKHFVPMDSRYGDYYGIMEYFLGYEGHDGHDMAGEKIASEGKEWAEKVLRKEDMQIYVLRLLLEYARILDDRREHLGWVDDVLKDPSLEKTWSWWW